MRPARARRPWTVLVAGTALVVTAGCAGGTSPSARPVLAPAPTASAPASGQTGVVPALLELPEQAVSAPVQPASVSDDGELVVPDDPGRLGWWVGGAQPGDPAGTAVVAGHVDSADLGLGVFASLREVAVGERVVLRSATGERRAYRVTDVLQVGKRALPRELFTRAGAPRLALITCAGDFDRASRSYKDNLVVLAVPEAGSST